MEILARLPVELAKQVLGSLTPSELSLHFELNDDYYFPTHTQYDQIRNLALNSRFSNRDLLIYDKFPSIASCYERYRKNSISIAISRLNHICRKRLLKKPKSVVLVLSNMLSAEDITALSNFFSGLWIENCKFDLTILVGFKSDEALLLVDKMIYSMQGKECNIQRFSISFSGIINFNQKLLSGECEHCGCVARSLRIKLFNPSKLHYVFNTIKDTFHQNNEGIESIDISFNNIAESHLLSLRFPHSLKSLDLSNNKLERLSELSPIWQLSTLEKLNLSNNNILKLYVPGSTQMRLRSLNISGNSVFNCSFLNANCFMHLETLNLSRNFITEINDLPKGLLQLDLSGNDLSTLLEKLDGRTFPKSIECLNLKYCHIVKSSTEIESAIQKLITTENLKNLKLAYFD